MSQDSVDDWGIFDETDDFHHTLTFAADERIHFENLFDQSGPVFPALLAKLSVFALRPVVVWLESTSGHAFSPALADVRITPVASHKLHNLFELGPGVATDEGGVTNILGDGNPANGPDWADLFNANGNVINPFGGTPAFVKDDLSAGSLLDRTVYSGGPSDKNSDKIADWTWGTSSVPAKDDITNA